MNEQRETSWGTIEETGFSRRAAVSQTGFSYPETRNIHLVITAESGSIKQQDISGMQGWLSVTVMVGSSMFLAFSTGRHANRMRSKDGKNAGKFFLPSVVNFQGVQHLDEIHTVVIHNVGFAQIQTGYRLHFFVGQLKVPDVEVFLNPFFVHGFRDHHHTPLHIPAKDHLTGGLVVGFGNLRQNRIGENPELSLCERSQASGITPYSCIVFGASGWWIRSRSR